MALLQHAGGGFCCGYAVISGFWIEARPFPPPAYAPPKIETSIGEGGGNRCSQHRRAVFSNRCCVVVTATVDSLPPTGSMQVVLATFVLNAGTKSVRVFFYDLLNVQTLHQVLTIWIWEEACCAHPLAKGEGGGGGYGKGAA